MNKPTAFEIDLQRINKDVSELEQAKETASLAIPQTIKYVYRLYQRASVTSNLKELIHAEKVIDETIARIDNPADLYYLKASVDMKLHRVASAKENLTKVSGLRDSPQGRIIEADIDFYDGNYEAAERAYEKLIQEERSWDNLARLAYLKFKLGDIARAEQLYIEAEDEITAKDMRSFAWVELQRGVLKLTNGSLEEALAHYLRADRAYPGYWAVDEHLAELYGVQERFEEAITLYKRVLSQVEKPELQQAVGELYAMLGNEEEAERWFELSLKNYMESIGRGEVHYYHHLADFYCDVKEDGPEAVKWAGKDLETRDNFSTQAAYAWALYRNGEFEEALKYMSKALASGLQDAQTFHKAAMIHYALGNKDEGDHYLQKAADINPHYNGFHVHH
jgi:tetratricopeptide (TPR) repeat protein